MVGCTSSGTTIEETIKNGEEARKEWTIAAIESGVIIPEPISPIEHTVNRAIAIQLL
ncbi:hypothetical protein [Ruminococcus sp.]|uniref:hypothetical protein n=1 Tax=Ruminococcus sp. TaxID=41978 RepID=UPI003FA7DB03